MINALHKACYESGRLIDVRETLIDEGSDSINAVELTFEALTVTLSVQPDDDTVLASLSSLSNDEIFRTTRQSFWSTCIGKGLQWAWLLTNQQGYKDGIRLEFHNVDEQDSVIVELIALASSFEFFIASKHEV